MKLKLVKHGEFLGTVCDFYVDEENNIYMSRTQIGYALQYKDPANAILRIHQRHYERFANMFVYVKGCQFVTPSPNKDKNAHKMCIRDRVRGTHGTYRPETKSEEEAYLAKKYGNNKYAK